MKKENKRAKEQLCQDYKEAIINMVNQINNVEKLKYIFKMVSRQILKK